MDFNDYQAKAITTDVFGGKPQPIDSHAFLAQLLGLMGETGEIADKFKKIYRDKNGVLSKEDKTDMTKELGDVLWYISVVSTYLGISLEDVATQNIEKLFSRKERDVLRGSGDNR
ncbi:MAG: hypothetical protein JWO47_440 [Candidatus Saccharibacteria bacterium]|nr:hypothetical protein [Candidatus Saccharibacteria bacterium]